MIKEKFSKFEKIEFSKKTKRITITAVITFLVFIFFIWLGIGMYVSVPMEKRGELWPVFGMYAIFPLLIFYFGTRRVYGIFNGDEDPETKEPDETEPDEQ